MTEIGSDDRNDELPPLTPRGVAGFTLALIVAMAAPFIIDGGFIP